MRKRFLTACWAVCVGACLLLGADSMVQGAESTSVMQGDPGGRILATGRGRVVILGRTGEVLWKAKGGNCSDIWMLENGNVLHADGNVTEIDPRTDKVVFSYKSAVTKGGGAFSCQRLADGRTLVGENSTGRVLEVDSAGKVVFEMKLEPYKAGGHHNFRMVRKLKNGNYLVCHSGQGLVREYTPEKKIVFEVKVSKVAYSAIRLPNGNTVVGHIDFISEFDAEGKLVWQLDRKELGDQVPGMICGVHVQPNGNLAAGLYRAYNKKTGTGCGLFEITREKKIVWRYANPKGDAAMMSLQKLDGEGRPLPGDVLR